MPARNGVVLRLEQFARFRNAALRIAAITPLRKQTTNALWYDYYTNPYKCSRTSMIWQLLPLLAFVGQEVASESPWTAAVLTRDRPVSLARLVESINGSQPENLRINLHFCVDITLNWITGHPATLDYIKSLYWPRGSVSYRVWASPMSVVGQWLNCWDTEWNRTVILEDDLELAPYALAWLDDAQDRLRNDNSIIGFSLQRQTNCFHTTLCKSRKLSIPWSIHEYKYLLVGSWGYAPVAQHWNLFRQWVREMQTTNISYIPHVDALLPAHWYKDMLRRGRAHTMWTMWMIDYCNRNRLYTVYYNHPVPQTLATHWAERGAHFNGKPSNYDFDKVTYSVLFNDSIHRDHLPTIDWSGTLDESNLVDMQYSAIAQAALACTNRNRVPLITFVNAEFSDMIQHFLCNLRLVAPQLLSDLILIAVDPKIYDRLRADRTQWGYAVEPLGTNAGFVQEELLFGTVRYYDLMLKRSRALLAILEQGISLFLFECDAVVRSDFVATFAASARAERADIVAIQDNPTFKRKNPNGGFMFLSNSTATLTLWKSMIDEFAANLKPYAMGDQTRQIKIQNDQDILTRLIDVDNGRHLRVHIMNQTQYMSGYVFKQPKPHELVRSAQVILLNFIVGLQAKRRKALEFNLWFSVNQSGLCELEQPRGRLFSVKTVY